MDILSQEELTSNDPEIRYRAVCKIIYSKMHKANLEYKRIIYEGIAKVDDNKEVIEDKPQD